MPTAPSSRRAVGPRPTTVRLIERIVALQMRQVPLETFAAEMVPLLLDAFDAPAGALLLYQCESETLAMIGSRGLSAVGRQHLERLRRGAADSWEIPLHGLLNRKAYVIERPDEHPFVPELAARDVMPHAANLASIPLYRGQLPVGVLLALADRRPIGEGEILAHVLAFDALSLALDAYLRDRAVPMATPPADGAGELARLVVVDGATDPEAGKAEGALVCEPWIEPREIAARLEGELATEQAARRALADHLADLEQGLADATADLDRAAAEQARLLAEREAELERALASERRRFEDVAADLRDAVAARDAMVTARDGALAALAAERDRVTAVLTDERDTARRSAGEAGDLVRQLRGAVASVESEREALRAAHAEAMVHREAAARDVARLDTELVELRGEATRLRDDRARVLAAVDQPGAEPATVIRALREKVAAFESEIGAHATERAEVARRSALQAEQVAQQLAAQRHEIEELRAAHERTLADVHASHARVLADARTAHTNALAAATVEHDRVRADQDARQHAVVATMRSEHADALGRALAERDARENELERLVVERDDLEARLAWALAEREEVAVAASVRERAAVARLESEQRDAAAARAMLEEERVAVEHARTATAERLMSLERELEARDERVAASARELEARDVELAAVRTQVARLCEDRDRVLAVVDDPGAEPAAVIQALRERVVSFESQVRGVEEERIQAADRAAAELERAEHRLAVQRRELAEERAAQRAALDEAQAAARRDVEAAHAEQRRERDADGAAHRDEIAALRASAERLDGERRAALAQIEADRDAALAATRELRAALVVRESRDGEREQTVVELAAERARLEQAAAAAAGEVDRARARLTDLDREHVALRSQFDALAVTDRERAAQLATLEADRARAETTRAEAEGRAEQLATALAVVQAEAFRLREDRARVLAAVDDDGAEPVTVIRALREQTVALEGQLSAYAAERAELGRRAAAEARAAEERLAIVRAERNAADAEHRRELEAAAAEQIRAREEAREAQRQALVDAASAYQRELATRGAENARLDGDRRKAVEAATAARQALAAAQRAHEAALADATAEREALRTALTAAASAPAAHAPRLEPARPDPAVATEASRPADALIAAAAAPIDAAPIAVLTPAADAEGAPAVTPAGDADGDAAVTPPPTVEVVTRGGHHILEADATRWEQIHAVLAAELPATPGRTLMVANLLAAFPAGLYDLTAAAKAGATLVGYAADAHGRSRILGAVRCFTDPPTAAESAAVFESLPKGPRRVLTLSEDVEAFLDAKMGLAKAGHSVSMACDAKQALDLLAMFTPDAVFIDLRTAPNAAAEFLAALAPESGRVLVVLVHGDPAGNVLPCVIQRLLRPMPLDPADLVQVCRNVLAGPPSAPVRGTPLKAIRPLERPKVLAPRKPLARRLVPRRR